MFKTYHTKATIVLGTAIYNRILGKETALISVSFCVKKSSNVPSLLGYLQEVKEVGRMEEIVVALKVKKVVNQNY